MTTERPETSVSRGRRIGYVVSQFPCYDETFILREMRAVAARDVEIVIFSLRRRSQTIVQEDALPFLPQTRYASYIGPATARAAAAALLRQPRAVLSLAWKLVSDLWRRPLTLAKALAFLPKSVRFAELCRHEGVERLHAHWATHPATAALLMSQLTGIPWSFTCHAHDIFFDPILLPEKLARADFALTCTRHNQKYLQSLANGAAAKIRVSYHGLDLSVFRPPDERPAKIELEILAVGSLLECKGFSRLIEALALLRDRGLPLRATIAGGGPDEARLRGLLRDRNLEDRVELTGYVTQRDLVPLYQRADLFVLPTVEEIHWGIPNVLVEALACGLPVVTTSLPSVGELVEQEKEGLLVPDGDLPLLAEGIERLARAPELRRRMGRRGRERVEDLFDINRTIESVLEPLLSKA